MKCSVVILLMCTVNVRAMEHTMEKGSSIINDYRLTPADAAMSQEVVERLHAAFKTAFPVTTNLTIVPLLGGFSQVRHKFRCSVDGKEYVACILATPVAERTKEIAAHRIAGGIGHAPTLHYCNDDSTVIIMDFINNHTVRMPDDGALPLVFLDQAAQFCRRMRDVSGDTVYQFPHMDIFTDMYQWGEQILAGRDTTVAVLTARALAKIPTLEHNIRATCRPSVFCHGDLHSRNMIFHHQQLIVIDWETAGSTYELWDLVTVAVTLSLDTTAERYLLARYLQKEPSIDDWHYFTWLKLVRLASDALGTYAYLAVHAKDQKFYPPPLGKTWRDYAKMYANDAAANSPQFLYELACSLMHEFLAHDDGILASLSDC